MNKCCIFLSAVLTTVLLSGCASPLLNQAQVSNQSAREALPKIPQVISKNRNFINATQLSRYTTIQNGPTRSEVNPLLAISTFTFPPTIYTVGQAIHQVLATTGYQLAPHLSFVVKKTLHEPLPITDRQLGPMKIQSALEVLMGEEVFDLQRDPLNRLVNFNVKPSIAKALGVKIDG